MLSAPPGFSCSGADSGSRRQPHLKSCAAIKQRRGMASMGKFRGENLDLCRAQSNSSGGWRLSAIFCPVYRFIAVPGVNHYLFHLISPLPQGAGRAAHKTGTSAAAAAQRPGNRHKPDLHSLLGALFMETDGPEMGVKCGNIHHIIW